MKKLKTVIAAEAALKAKQNELEQAQLTIQRLGVDLIQARAALKAAQTEADASLPRCRMVAVYSRTGKEEGVGATYVIVRKTLSGLLVVRRPGDDEECSAKFKWYEHTESYRESAKRRGYNNYVLELREVPAEYLPTKRKQHDT